jgi:hypothetical protein
MTVRRHWFHPSRIINGLSVSMTKDALALVGVAVGVVHDTVQGI